MRFRLSKEIVGIFLMTDDAEDVLASALPEESEGGCWSGFMSTI